MPALNFQKQFAGAVEAGEKRQTIRAPRKDKRMPAKRGDTIALYTGMRTKHCRKLMDVLCTKVTTVTIARAGIWVTGEEVNDKDEFAQADGFSNAEEMLSWFEKTHRLPFQGWLIMWKPAENRE